MVKEYETWCKKDNSTAWPMKFAYDPDNMDPTHADVCVQEIAVIPEYYNEDGYEITFGSYYSISADWPKKLISKLNKIGKDKKTFIDGIHKLMIKDGELGEWSWSND